MDTNIQDILSNYVYYITSMNITDDGTSSHNALMEAKQISLKIQKMQDDCNNFEKKSHVSRMCELSKELYAVLAKKSLQEIWNKLSDLEQKPEKKISSKEATWRINDLVVDVQEFYEVYEKDCSKFIVDFDSFHILNTSLDYETTVKNFYLLSVKLVEIMDDLDERLSVLMHLIDPNSKKQLIWRTCSSTQASLIVKRARIIALNNFDDNDIQEMSRLNRRMYVVLKEAEFLKFSERDAKRVEIIKKLSKFSVLFPEDKACQNQYVKIAKQIDDLEEDIKKHRESYLQKCIQYDWTFYQFATIEETNNYIRNEEIMTEIFNFLEDVYNKFELFLYCFHEIRELVDEAWNT